MWAFQSAQEVVHRAETEIPASWMNAGKALAASGFAVIDNFLGGSSGAVSGKASVGKLRKEIMQFYQNESQCFEVRRITP